MALRKPIISEIAKDTWLINEYGCNNMYVLAGSTRSLVIDAGGGYCDFKGIVESLTDKPYDVVITHAHPDHVGMMHQFDKIFINEKETEMLALFVRPDFDLRDFDMNNRQHLGNWEVWEVTEDMINRGNKDTELVYIDEGFAFDLGNRKVTSYCLPGHTKGHMYFIDDYSRIAFTGDCVNHNNGTNCTAVSTHIRNLKKLLDGYEKTYDRIFTGHCTYCGLLDVKSHSINIVRNLMEAFRSILRGDAVYGETPNFIFPEMPPRKVVLFGENPQVTPNFPDLLWEDGEEQIIP